MSYVDIYIYVYIYGVCPEIGASHTSKIRIYKIDTSESGGLFCSGIIFFPLCFFFDFCFPASLLFCFLLFCFLLFCFSLPLCFCSSLFLCFSTAASLLLRFSSFPAFPCFSAFPASVLLCFLLFPASLLPVFFAYLLFCFSAFPSFLFLILQIILVQISPKSTINKPQTNQTSTKTTLSKP